MVRLTDRPDMTLDVYRGRKTTIQYNTIQYNTIQYNSSSYLKLLAPQSKLTGTRKFTLRYQ